MPKKRKPITSQGLLKETCYFYEDELEAIAEAARQEKVLSSGDRPAGGPGLREAQGRVTALLRVGSGEIVLVGAAQAQGWLPKAPRRVPSQWTTVKKMSSRSCWR